LTVDAALVARGEIPDLAAAPAIDGAEGDATSANDTIKVPMRTEIDDTFVKAVFFPGQCSAQAV